MNRKWMYLLYGAGYILWIIFGLVRFFGSTDEMTAFWQLPEKVNTLLILLIWPLIVSLVAGLLGKFIISRLYLWVFQKLNKNVHIGYLENNNFEKTNKLTLFRLFNLFLVTLGIVNAMLAANFLFPENFITATQAENWASAGIEAKYTPTILSQILCLMIPIAFGLLIVSWTLEDLGLVQYKLPQAEKGDNFLEIQPLFKGYSSYISGYGGISSLIFYAGFFIYYFGEYSHRGGNFADLILFLFLALVFLSIIPVYLIIERISAKKIIKGIKLAPKFEVHQNYTFKE